jgi:restriction system protein
MPFCTNCGKKISLFINKYKSDDGWKICDSCFETFQLKQENIQDNHDTLNKTNNAYKLGLKDIFKQFGYDVLVKSDYEFKGADFILSKNEETIVVRLKHHDRTITDRSIQEIITAKEYYKADKARIVTNGLLSPSAEELAMKNHVEIWEEKQLKNVINNLEKNTGKKELVQKETQSFSEKSELKEIITNCPYCAKEFSVELKIKGTGEFKIKCPYCGGLSKGNF